MGTLKMQDMKIWHRKMQHNLVGWKVQDMNMRGGE